MNKTYTVYSDKIKKDKRIIMLSDIHYEPGMKLDFLYNQLEKLKTDMPDYVTILGDLINDGLFSQEELKDLREWLYELSKLDCKIINILGNHEQLTQKNSKNWEECYNPNYVNMLKNYNNFIVLQNQTLEEEEIMFGGTRFSGDYYDKRIEPTDEYKETVQKAIFNPDKMNILLDHSPINSFQSETFESISTLDDVDMVLSGHMHNGCVPTYISKWLPGNRGFVDPYMRLLPNNARGKKEITDHTTGIISAPITTFTGYQGILSKFNVFLPPMTQQVLIKKK